VGRDPDLLSPCIRRLELKRKPATPPPVQPSFSERQRQQRLWQALNEYISDNEGFVTSSPNEVNFIRFEIVPALSRILPELLRSRGYDLRDAGVAERLLPVVETLKQLGGNTTVTREHIAPQQVLIFEFRLPE
jgi:hypothetical protein